MFFFFLFILRWYPWQRRRWGGSEGGSGDFRGRTMTLKGGGGLTSVWHREKKARITNLRNSDNDLKKKMYATALN